MKRSWTISLAGVPLDVDGIQLISLLEHDSPVAYVTDGIATKDHIRSAKTRPLTRFEESSLEKVRTGAEVVLEGTFDAGESPHAAVGAVRAKKQCLSCHDAEVGDLLGAFSYRFSEIEMDRPAGATTMTRWTRGS